MKSARIDIAAVARAALDAADRLVPMWLPGGRRNGHEWVAPNPTRSDRHAGSFSVNLVTGMWSDFATDDKGGDLVALYAYLFTGGVQLAAARQLAGDLRIAPESVPQEKPAPARNATPWRPITPVPQDAPAAPVAHLKRGRPVRTWTYRDQQGWILGYVHRFETSDGGKEILPVVWARNADTGACDWRWMQWTAPRPIYGLERLRAGPTVLITEGEKCADAAHELLGEHLDCLSWPGGGKAVDKVDWTPLAGRKVIIWPDCDAQSDRDGQMLPAARQPGMVAAERIAEILVAQGCEVRLVDIPAPGAKPSGWDIADAIAEGADAEAIKAILLKLRKPACSVDAAPAPTKAARAGRGKRVAPDWEAGLLERRGEIVACLSNVVMVLSNREEWDGVIGFDEFAMRTMKRARGPNDPSTFEPGEWTDTDTSRAIIWLTTAYGMTPTTGVVDEAIELIGRGAAFHPVREYLSGLEWDGTARLDTWLEDFLGVPRTEYSVRVGRWFLIAMVARVMEPGCKFDNCLVLEGTQGLRKSSALRALCGPGWFSETDLDLSNKDSMSALRGKWLHEVAEMGSLARAESARQKSFLSRQIDEFRPAYARREIRCPRQIVFAGTTNEWSWNKDPTGGRRFWPVSISGDIDVVGLAAMRDQLFAEALVRYRDRERYWPTSEEQRKLFDPEQLRRESQEPLEDMVYDWLHGLQREEFTLAELMTDALKLDAGKMTRDMSTRVGSLLHKLGCSKREKRNGVTRFMYGIPAWTSYALAQQKLRDAGDRDGPLPL